MLDDTMEVDHVMDVEEGVAQPTYQASESEPTDAPLEPTIVAPQASTSVATVAAKQPQPIPARDSFRDIAVKVHIRNPEKDSWSYVGRALVTQEGTGYSTRVVVRAVSTGKTLTSFNENTALQAEKRGNFVVVGCIDDNRHVKSWSFNALNNSETLRLLAIIELTCYHCKQAMADPRAHSKTRHRIERTIKEDRRRRHRRRKEQDSMVDMFAKSNIGEVAASPPVEQ